MSPARQLTISLSFPAIVPGGGDGGGGGVDPTPPPATAAELKARIDALANPADPYRFTLEGFFMPSVGDVIGGSGLTQRPDLAQGGQPMVLRAGVAGVALDGAGRYAARGLMLPAGTIVMGTRGVWQGCVATADSANRILLSLGDPESGSTDGIALKTYASRGQATAGASDLQLSNTFSSRSNLPFATGQFRHAYVYKNTSAGLYLDGVGRLGLNAPFAQTIKEFGLPAYSGATFHVYGDIPCDATDKAVYFNPTVGGAASTETHAANYWGYGIPTAAQHQLIAGFLETYCGCAPDPAVWHLGVGNSITQGDTTGGRNGWNLVTHTPAGSVAPTTLNRGITGITHDQLEAHRQLAQRSWDFSAVTRATMSWWEGVNQDLTNDAAITNYFTRCAAWRALSSKLRLALAITIPEERYRGYASPDADYADLRDWFIHRATTETATFANGLIRLDLDPVMGAVNADLDPTYYSTDGVSRNVHPNDTGQAQLDDEYQAGHSALMAMA